MVPTLLYHPLCYRSIPTCAFALYRILYLIASQNLRVPASFVRAFHEAMRPKLHEGNHLIVTALVWSLGACIPGQTARCGCFLRKRHAPYNIMLGHMLPAAGAAHA